MRRGAALALALVTASAVATGTAHAGAVTQVIEAPTTAALSLAVSQASFGEGATADVVLAPAGDADVVAVAAAFAGHHDRPAPLLLVGPGVSPGQLRAEAQRVTAGSGRVWLLGTELSGLGGLEVERITGDAAEMAGELARTGSRGGTADRLMVYAAGDWQSGALAAAFGAAYGVPVLPFNGDVPAAFAGEPPLTAVAVGGVEVPADRFAAVVRITGADPSRLSVAVAQELFAPERPAGIAVAHPVHPVAADGFGSEPGPALLASTVSVVRQHAGLKGPLVLVDGRPGPDLAAGCAGGGPAAPAECFLAEAEGNTTVLALRAERGEVAGRAVRRLPATGPAAVVPVIGLVALVLALVLKEKTWTAGHS